MPTTVEHSRLYRGSEGKLLGGVAVGLAEHFNVSVRNARITFAVLALAGGAGVLLYGAFWIFVPQSDPSTGSISGDANKSWVQIAAIGAVTLVGFLFLNTVGLFPGGSSALPLVIALIGAALVWRQADESQRRRWRSVTEGPRGGVLRNVAGSLLVVAGVLGFIVARGDFTAARQGIVATVVIVAGISVLTAPWWLKLTSDLTLERRERIRSEERAEVAAHIHDSVLQTLTLIQKSASKPTEVRRLARSQERELRSWLYRPETRGTIVAALEQNAAEVEEDFAIPVDVVAVGDCAQDAALAALCAAAREAMVNAAKHSGAADISVYVEVEQTLVIVFVRDRGCGFDPDSVPADRFGLAESIKGRIERHGGHVSIKTAKDDGTEVRLEMPRG